MSILVVDDYEGNLTLLSAQLKQAGYQGVEVAGSAQEAFEILQTKNKKAQKGLIDLILMDIQMPEMDGIQACQQIKQSEVWKDIPVIMVTAADEMDFLERAFEAGAIDYVRKPVKKVELFARIRSVLKMKREMDTRKAREQELVKRNEELERASKEIKTLQGFIPICAFCKKIRNMDGMWEQMEQYIQDRSDAKFSHGYCQDCIREQYPEYHENNE